MRIWLGTWNAEQQFPTIPQLQTLFTHCNAGIRADSCDLIVMGLQECTRNHAVPNIGGYQLVNHLTALGQTKNKENCQALFIWEKNAAVPKGAVTHIGQSRLLVTERTLKRKIKFWAEYGKGTANNMVEWSPTGADTRPPWRIVISSAHLDSKDADKRTAQVNAAMNAANTMAPFGLWDVHFLMGDLNFRVNKSVPYTLPKFCDLICNNRYRLFDADSLADDSTLGRNGPWTFPPPYAGAAGAGNALIYPSYKKFYKGSAKATAEAAAGRLPANPTTNVPLVYDLSTDKQGNVKEGSRAGQYDMGWLDRIGFRVRTGSGRSVKLLYAGSPVDLILSDHAPVYSIFEVT